MRRFSFVHVGVAAGLAAATVIGVGVIQQVSATGASSSVFVPITPCRLADTRPAPDNVGARNTALGQGESVTFQVTGTNGTCSIPTSATAITGNMTAVGPTASGFLTAYPTGATRPLTSNLNFVAGNAPIGNSFTATLSSSGAIDVFNNAGRVDAIIDINGYYESVTSTAGVTNRISNTQIAMLRWDQDPSKPATVTVGSGPIGLAFDGTSMWVANGDSNTVSKINPATNTVTATIAVGESPYGVAFDGTNIWVANSGDTTVSKINPTTNAVIATVTVSGDPIGVAFDGTNLWVTNFNAGTVVKINPATNAVSAPIAAGSFPSALAFDGSSIWVTNNLSTTVKKINPTTNAVTATVTVGSNPSAIAFDGANIWVTNSGSNSVSKINPTTNAPTTLISSFNRPQGVAFDGTNIWVTNSSTGAMSKINPSTGAIAGTFTVGSNPTGVAFDGANIWVANNGGTTVSKLRVG